MSHQRMPQSSQRTSNGPWMPFSGNWTSCPGHPPIHCLFPLQPSDWPVHNTDHGEEVSLAGQRRRPGPQRRGHTAGPWIADRVRLQGQERAARTPSFLPRYPVVAARQTLALGLAPEDHAALWSQQVPCPGLHSPELPASLVEMNDVFFQGFHNHCNKVLTRISNQRPKPSPQNELQPSLTPPSSLHYVEKK